MLIFLRKSRAEVMTQAADPGATDNADYCTDHRFAAPWRLRGKSTDDIRYTSYNSSSI